MFFILFPLNFYSINDRPEKTEYSTLPRVLSKDIGFFTPVIAKVNA